MEATAAIDTPSCVGDIALRDINSQVLGRRLEATATIETPSIVGPGDELERLSAGGLLTRLAASARLFRSADGRFCAQVPVGDRLEIFGLRSAAMRDWLIDGYLVSQPEPPSGWAIRRVVGMLEARARFSSGVPEVFIRVGHDGEGRDSAYFLDLGDPSGRAVAIRDQGWCVVDRPGVHFRRPAGQLSMPMPVHDGSIDFHRIRGQRIITWKAERQPSTDTPAESEGGNDNAGADCSADLL